MPEQSVNRLMQHDRIGIRITHFVECRSLALHKSNSAAPVADTETARMVTGASATAAAPVGRNCSPRCSPELALNRVSLTLNDFNVKFGEKHRDGDGLNGTRLLYQC